MTTSTAIKTLDERIEEADHASITVAEQLAMSRAEVAELRAALEAAEKLREAVGRLVKAKGRYHTEQNYAAVVAAHDAVMAQKGGAA